MDKYQEQFQQEIDQRQRDLDELKTEKTICEETLKLNKEKLATLNQQFEGTIF